MDPNVSLFSRLEEIVAVLRGPDGCPWDIKQTPASLIPYLEEECRELIKAIENEDQSEICEEIGDVLFILVMMIRMFAERESFMSNQVLEGIIAKMIRRHPHVFGTVKLSDEPALRAQWQRIKAEEKRETSIPLASNRFSP